MFLFSTYLVKIWEFGLYGSTGFGSIGFGSIGFDSIGFDSIGFDSIGFDSIGFGSIGFGSIGFGSIGFGSIGFGSAGFRSLTLSDSEDPPAVMPEPATDLCTSSVIFLVSPLQVSNSRYLAMIIQQLHLRNYLLPTLAYLCRWHTMLWSGAF
jgi:hypothetical protein